MTDLRWLSGNAFAVVIVACGVAMMFAAKPVGNALAEIIKARAEAHKAKADDVREMTAGMKAALKELQPNGGGSIKDVVGKIEKRLEKGDERFAQIEQAFADARALAESRHNGHTAEHQELLAAIAGKADAKPAKPAAKPMAKTPKRTR